MIVQNYAPFRGLNTQTNDLQDKAGFAIDSLNMTIDKANLELEKRAGVAERDIGTNTATRAHKGMFQYADKTLLVRRTSATDENLHLLTATSSTAIKKGGNVLYPSLFQGTYSNTQYNDVLYWTRKDLGTIKYDGNATAVAGAPPSLVSGIVSGASHLFITAGTYKLLIEVTSLDAQGNLTVGLNNYTPIITTTTQRITIPAETLINFKVDSFGFGRFINNKFARCSSAVVTNSTNTSIAIPVSAGATLTAGDWVFMPYTNVLPASFAEGWRAFEVESYNSGTNTLTIKNPIIGLQATKVFYGGNLLISQALVSLWVDFGSSGNYRESRRLYDTNSTAIGVNGFTGNNNSYPVVFDTTTGISVNTIVTLHEGTATLQTNPVYGNIEVERYYPPTCKYIAEYGGNLVLANGGYFNIEEPYAVYWSTPSLGGFECFSPNNFFLVGDSRDGEITGIKETAGALVVFKEQAIYLVNGALDTGGFNVQRLFTKLGHINETIFDNGTEVVTYIQNDIVDAVGSIYFFSNDGIYQYRVGEAVPTLISGRIQALYVEAIKNILNVHGAIDPTNRKILWTLNMKPGFNSFCIEYDYEADAFWLHDAPLGEFGLVHDGSKFVGLKTRLEKWVTATGTSGTNRVQEQASKIDTYENTPTNTAISCRVRFAWQSLGANNVAKKILKLYLYAFKSTTEAVTYTLKLYKNWRVNTTATNTSVTLPVDETIIEKRMDGGLGKHFSTSVEFSNNLLTDMRISGYDLEIEGTYNDSKTFGNK